jgi:hypothetical protein
MTLATRCMTTTATTGTGALTLSATGVRDAALGDCLAPAEMLSVLASASVPYIITSGNNFAHGLGTLSSDGLTLTRDAGEVSWNGTALSAALLSLTGTSTVDFNPRAVDIANPAIIDVFTSSGTWTKRDGVKAVFVMAVGGGGGGGGARKGAAASARSGGGGGAGGGATYADFGASALGATETVTVGSGGSSLAAVTANSTNGGNGGAGGASTFGAWLKALGGVGGGGSGTFISGTTVVPGGAATVNASNTGGVGVAGVRSTGLGGASGAAGGGVTSADVVGAGAAGGGDGGPRSGLTSAGGGAAVSTSATDRASGDWLGGQGGGSGAGSNTGNGGGGGNGAKPGGGGGGAGAATDGVGNTGVSGAGGSGLVVVINYF